MIERDERIRRERERRAKRAIGWGTAIVLGLMVLGMMALFFPVVTGFRIPYMVSSLDLIVGITAGAIGLIGLVVVVYGLVQLGRSRPRHEHTA